MEQKLSNMPVREKVKYILRVILIMFIISILAAFAALFITGRSMTKFYNQPYVNSTLQMEARKNMQMVAKNLLWAATTDNAAAQKEGISLANNYAADVADNIEKLNETFKDKDLLANLNKEFEAMKAERAKIVQLLESGKKDEAVSVYEKEYAEELEDMQNALLAVGNKADQNAVTEYRNSQITNWIAVAVLLLIMLATLAVTVKLGKLLGHIILEPISEIEKAAKQIADGNLEADLNYESEDEFGQLSTSMRTMMQQNGEIITDISNTLTAMSNGDFQVESGAEDHYIGDYATILEAMYLIRDNLNSTMLNIDDSAEQVAQGSVQMAMSAQELAEGATDQAEQLRN